MNIRVKGWAAKQKWLNELQKDTIMNVKYTTESEIKPDIYLDNHNTALYILKRDNKIDEMLNYATNFDKVVFVLLNNELSLESITEFELKLFNCQFGHKLMLLNDINDVKEIIQSIIVNSSSFQNGELFDYLSKSEIKKIIKSSFDLVLNESNCTNDHESLVLGESISNVYNLATATKPQLLDCPLEEDVCNDIIGYFSADYLV